MFGFIRKAFGNGVAQAYNNGDFNEVTVGLYDTEIISALPVVATFENSHQFHNQELDQDFSFSEMVSWASEFFVNALPFGGGVPFLRTIEEYSADYQRTQDPYYLGLLNAHILVWDRAMGY